MWPPTEGEGKCIVQHRRCRCRPVALPEELTACGAALQAVGIDAHDQIGIARLERRVDQVAGEDCLVAALAGADREMIWGVAGGRAEADVVVEGRGRWSPARPCWPR